MFVSRVFKTESELCSFAVTLFLCGGRGSLPCRPAVLFLCLKVGILREIEDFFFFTLSFLNVKYCVEFGGVNVFVCVHVCLSVCACFQCCERSLISV